MIIRVFIVQATVATIVNYNRNTFIAQATGPIVQTRFCVSINIPIYIAQEEIVINKILFFNCSSGSGIRTLDLKIISRLLQLLDIKIIPK